MSDSVSAAIVAANKAPEPGRVAAALVSGLFDRQSGQKLSTLARYVAEKMLTEALTAWKLQLMAGTDARIKEYHDMARDARMEADELRLAIAMKEAEGK